MSKHGGAKVQASAFMLWEQAERYICDCHDQGSALHRVDTEMPRAPNMSTRFSEHGSVSVPVTRSLHAMGTGKRYTFYQPLGFHESACYVHEHGSLNELVFS